MFKAVSVLQYVIILIISSVILQILIQGRYTSYLVIYVTIISYITASTILATLSYKVVTWFKISRDVISFLFFIGSAMVAGNLAVGAVIHSYYIWSEESPDAPS